jgi:hypothetical protein
MAIPRIELVDQSPEGQRVAEALRERGYYVLERSLESLSDGTDAALVLLAGDAPGAMGALAALRNGVAPLVPVLLLGSPPHGTSEDTLDLDVQGEYPRPVAMERLVRRVEGFVAPPDLGPPPMEMSPPSDVIPLRPVERTMRLGDPDEGDSWRPIERTEQLETTESVAARPVAPEPSGGDSVPPPSLVGFSDVPRSPEMDGPGAPLSDRLRRMMAAADRRVFPALPPLDLRFRVGDESARELVPDELLDAVAMPVEPIDEDPLEAFTYLGPAPEPVLSSASAGAPSDGLWGAETGAWVRASDEVPGPGSPRLVTETNVRAPAPARTPSSSGERAPLRSRSGAGRTADDPPPASTISDLGIGEPLPGGRGRAGSIRDGDVIRLLFHVVDRRMRAELRLTLPETQIRLCVAGDRLESLDGPVHQRVLARLAIDRRIADSGVTSEPGAFAETERLVGAGILSRYEIERRLRRERGR